MPRSALLAAMMIVACAGCGRSPNRPGAEAGTPWRVEIDEDTARVIARARREVERRVRYDASYRRISYPAGDVPEKVGSCTDLVIRALRARDIDLQVLVQQDRRRAPGAYATEPRDPSIDHRRCRNLIVFFKRHGKALTLDPHDLDQWRPGDLVFWDLSGKGLLHTGIVSDRLGPSGNPMIIHNVGPVASEDDRLADWKIIGHFRYPPRPGPARHGRASSATGFRLR